MTVIQKFFYILFWRFQMGKKKYRRQCVSLYTGDHQGRSLKTLKWRARSGWRGFDIKCGLGRQHSSPDCLAPYRQEMNPTQPTLLLLLSRHLVPKQWLQQQELYFSGIIKKIPPFGIGPPNITKIIRSRWR